MKFPNTWRGKRGGRRNPEGPVSVFASYGPGSAGQHPKFRQASFKTAADAVEVSSSRGNPRGYGNLVPEERSFGGQTFRHERTLDTKREAEEYAGTLRAAGLKARVVKSGWGGGSHDVYSSRAAFRGKSPRERLGYDTYRNNPIEPLEPGRFKVHFNPAKDWGVDDSVVRSLGKVYLTYQGRRVAAASKGGTMHGVQLIDWIPLGGFQIWKRDGSPKFPHALAYKVKSLLGVE
jgi:hypothetical protein